MIEKLFTFAGSQQTFYKLSENVSDSSEYGGNTLNNIAKGKLWATCYIQFVNFLRIMREIKKTDVILASTCSINMDDVINLNPFESKELKFPKADVSSSPWKFVESEFISLLPPASLTESHQKCS